MTGLRQSYKPVAAALRQGDEPEPGQATRFLIDLEHLLRLATTRDLSTEDDSLLMESRAFLQNHREVVGQAAARALRDLPELPAEDVAPEQAESALRHHLEAAEEQALLVRHLPAEARAAVEKRLNGLKEELQYEPALFAPVSPWANQHLEQHHLTPLAPAWSIFHLAAQAAETAAEVAQLQPPNVGPILDRAWELAEKQGLVPLPAEEKEGLLARLLALLQPPPRPRLQFAETDPELGQQEPAPGGACSWFQVDRSTPGVEVQAPCIGHAPVLLFDRTSGRGNLAELGVSHDQTEPFWQAGGPLQTLARQTVFVACRSVARFMPHGWPRYPLEQHRFELTSVDGGGLEVDGASLGLPAACAMASLWQGIPLPGDLVSTGGLRFSADGASIMPVAKVYEKCMALRRLLHPSLDPSRVRVMAHERHVSDIVRAGLCPLPVLTLEDVFSRVGLDLSVAPSAEDMGSLKERMDALREAMDDVETQRIERYRGMGRLSPWLVLANRLTFMVDSLALNPAIPEPLLQRARVCIALAYLFAGDSEAAGKAIEGLTLYRSPPPPIQVLAQVVSLGIFIDKNQEEEGATLDGKLAAAAELLRPDEQAMLMGRVQGTRGRYRLHFGRARESVRLFEAAVAWHQDHLPWEAGRSLIYLATALRVTGQLDRALEKLDLSRQALEQETRAFYRPYFDMCLLYWNYERSRLHIARQEPLLALSHATEAYNDAGWRGWWPALGILRCISWALAVLGADEPRKIVLEKMGQLLPKVTSMREHGLARRMLEEARGEPRTDGEIY